MKENSIKSKECLKRQTALFPISQRIEFRPLKLNDLPLGEFQTLTQEELGCIKRLRRPEISQVLYI